MRATCLVLLAAGLAASTVAASAQSYPSGPYRSSGPYAASGSYPEAAYDDDDDQDVYAPAPDAPSHSAATPPYDGQPLPPPPARGPYATYPGAYPQPLPPPSSPHQDTYVVPNAGPPTVAPPRTAGVSREFEPVRPPGEVGPTGSVPGYGSAPAAGPHYGAPPFGAGPQEVDRAPTATVPGARQRYAALPPEDQPEEGPAKELDPRFRRQIVDYVTNEPPGTLVVDTPNTYLYLVLGGGKAMRYGIGVGREGFTWSGNQSITRMAEWPDWHPPKEMIDRQPYLPRFMAGGESNPMGARALYLGNTIYRIHGTNQPSTIGTFVSSGCIRLINEDVEDLYRRVSVGTKVVVLPGGKPGTPQANRPPATGNAQLPAAR